jgi:hypothetical protein
MNFQENFSLMEQVELKSWLSLYEDIPPAVAAPLGVRVERLGSAVAFVAAQLDAFIVNHVTGLGVAEPATEAQLDRIVEIYREAGITNYGVKLAPFAQPAELPEWLAARGLRPGDNHVKCYRGVEPPPAIQTDLQIVKIEPASRADFGKVVIGAFHMPEFTREWIESYVGLPGWQHYLALDGGQPVGAGALFMADGIGYLGFGATLPSYRKRGAQGAIMARRIQEAVALGCTGLITEAEEDTPQSPNPSYHNMLRTGFKLAYLRRNYLSPATLRGH